MPPEPDWYTSADPDWLIREVWTESASGYFTPGPEGNGPLARRLRLFAAASARQVWELLPQEARSAVETSERFADGRAGEPDLRAVAMRGSDGHTATYLAWSAARSATLEHPNLSYRRLSGPEQFLFRWNPLAAARTAARALATQAAGHAPLPNAPAAWHDAWTAAFHAARAVQADIARDIFPPPGVTPAVRPEWLTSAVLGLAHTMDETGDFSAAPILADALQDAGCADPEILNRLRHPGPHVRGCWPVDRVLGRG